MLAAFALGLGSGLLLVHAWVAHAYRVSLDNLRTAKALLEAAQQIKSMDQRRIDAVGRAELDQPPRPVL